MRTKIEVLSLSTPDPAVAPVQRAIADVRFSLSREPQVMVPLGVPNSKNQPSNPYFHFNYSIRHQPATDLIFEVRDVNAQLCYRMEVDQAYTEPGDYLLLWDGFDSTDTFDSRRFDHAPLQASLIVGGPRGKTLSVFFSARYQVVPWVDVRISRVNKRIDVTLRTHFKDGGEGAIHRQAISNLTARSKSFEDLLDLAKEGLRYHWGRNSQHPVGKNIVLPDGHAYEVFVEAVNTPSQAIKSPKIVYQSNARSRRSRNWELSRILFYNTGQLLQAGKWFERKAGKWFQKNETQAEADFKQIAAHEIGHEILLAYGGHVYSKSHKGSSTILTQKPLGHCVYPATGEVDLMLYYTANANHPFPIDFHGRNIASETDVCSLLWLAQIGYQLV